MAVRFGPAGVPIQCKESSSIGGVRCCAELGLKAMEIEFSHGVRMSEDYAKEIKPVAEELDVSLSSHAPYYVNLCSAEKSTAKSSVKRIVHSAKLTSLTGGNITVFHPGYYQKHTPEEAYQAAKKALVEIQEELRENKIGIRLGAETVGKKSAFGGLEENIRLAQELEMVEPCIDFAHLLARGDFNIKTENDYRMIFGMLEKELGDYVQRFHCHFSEIEYSEKGERNHLPLGTRHEPPFKPFAKVLAENGYSGTVIIESPRLDFDALLLKSEYEKIKGEN
ncbi:TIM barrel protein [Candidatus Micrarchaeota archaeon]|nr:TIM barrel protein [Candidatus Micrarchaeota archaeon]